MAIAKDVRIFKTSTIANSAKHVPKLALQDDMSQFPQLEEAVKNFSKEMAHTEVDEQESQHEKTHLKELNKEQKKARDIIRIGKLTVLNAIMKSLKN